MRLSAMPNVGVEAGPTALCLAREVHHMPSAPRGPSAMPLGLASNDGLGRAGGGAGLLMVKILYKRREAWGCSGRGTPRLRRKLRISMVLHARDKRLARKLARKY